MQISTAIRNALLDSINAILGGTAYLQVRTGTKPANVDDADSGTLLATHTLSATALAAASNGTAAFNAIADDTDVDASGTAGHFRIKDGANAVHMQGTITATGGGGEIEFSTISFVAGGVSSITSLTLTMPIGT